MDSYIWFNVGAYVCKFDYFQTSKQLTKRHCCYKERTLRCRKSDELQLKHTIWKKTLKILLWIYRMESSVPNIFNVWRIVKILNKHSFVTSVNICFCQSLHTCLCSQVWKLKLKITLSLFFIDNIKAKQGSKYLTYCQKYYYGRQDGWRIEGQNFLYLIVFTNEAAQVYEIKSLEDICKRNFILFYKCKN